jgi:hypothetical protein
MLYCRHHNASPAIADAKGKRPIDLAAHSNLAEIALLLKEARRVCTGDAVTVHAVTLIARTRTAAKTPIGSASRVRASDGTAAAAWRAIGNTEGLRRECVIVCV